MISARSLFFLSSLAVNLALAAFLLAGAVSSSSPDSTPAPVAARPAVPPAPAAPVLDATVWPTLQGSPDDLPGLVARLRAAGFPPGIVRGIINGLLQEKLAARRKALDPEAGSRPYWKVDRPPDPKLVLALYQLSREHQRTVRELLGPETDEEIDAWSALARRRQLGFLSPERIDQIKAISDRYMEIRQDNYNPGGSVPADRVRQNELAQRERAEIVALFSASELEAYDLRTSVTANNLRFNLTQFNATEAEFISLFRLQKQLDDAFPWSGSPPTEEQTKRRADAEKTLQEQIKATLGPERYADYERSSDYGYRRTAQLATRLDLPPTAAPQAWSIQQDAQQRAVALRADTTLTDAQRAAQLTALAAEATARVTAAFGPRGFTEYQRVNGTWLRELTNPKK